MAALRVTTKVLSGNRIEVFTPGLQEGQSVEVTVVSEEAPPAPEQSLADYLKSLPPSTRTAQEWEEFDREFQRERDSWDR